MYLFVVRIVRANGNKLQPAQPSCRFTGGCRSVRVSHVTAVQIFARTAASNEVLDCLIAPERGGGNRFDDNQHAQLIAYASPRERVIPGAILCSLYKSYIVLVYVSMWMLLTLASQTHMNLVTALCYVYPTSPCHPLRVI